MKHIQNSKWSETVRYFDREKNREIEEQKEADLVQALTVLINNQPPEKMPRGIDKFRMMSRLTKSYDKAKTSGCICLEYSDYSYLKGIVEEGIPASWGVNENIQKAVEAFIDAKESCFKEEGDGKN